MSNTLSVRGTLEVGGDSCNTSCGGGSDRLIKTIELSCSPTYFQTIVTTPSSIQVQTQGAVGAQFVDIDVLGDLVGIEFFYAVTSTPMMLRIGAAPARLLGVAGVFPTLFAGGETLNLLIDTVPVAVVFDVIDQTAAQCAARINAACAFAGLPTPLCSVVGGQIQIAGVLTGPQGTVVVSSGTGAATLGLSGSAVGAGADVPLYGPFLAKFGVYPNVPARIQVSGAGGLSIVAAGRSAA